MIKAGGEADALVPAAPSSGNGNLAEEEEELGADAGGRVDGLSEETGPPAPIADGTAASRDGESSPYKKGWKIRILYEVPEMFFNLIIPLPGSLHFFSGVRPSCRGF